MAPRGSEVHIKTVYPSAARKADLPAPLQTLRLLRRFGRYMKKADTAKLLWSFFSQWLRPWRGARELAWRFTVVFRSLCLSGNTDC